MAGIGDFTILSENDSADAMDVAKNNMYEYLKNNDTGLSLTKHITIYV